ncbi:hypothetical protein ACFFTN_01520 [Aminobacter aganoensis]|uniref:Uncharacterized protein n=1 Tax=Aminobacter aganoensis TaxID=83264 RepID=A0A7X0KJV8_9HYPH|nr:hypothetical protein [Aminobacter aganoensis]MBB6353459.1 hypothetical protein [Aminobacter aganoensis]
MVGFAMIAGGAMQGYGSAQLEQAKAQREAALEEVRAQREMKFRSDEAATARRFDAEENEKTRAFQRENAQGDLIDMGGGKYGVRKGSRVEELTDASGKAVTVAPKAGFRLLTAEEKKAAGLDAGKAYQIDESGETKGKISAVGGEGTTVNVGGERGYDKTVGEEYGKRFMASQDDEKAANRTITALNVMAKSMEDPNFYSGSGAEIVTKLKRAAVAMGADPESVSSTETFNAMAKQAALDSMGGSLGSGFSNADRDFVTDQVPTLGNTPQGNRALIEVQKKIAQRKIQIAKLARDYAKGNEGRIDAGFDEELASWSEQNPLFPSVATAGAPKVGTIDGGYRFKGGDPADQNNWEIAR